MSVQFKDYYDLLGVGRNATADEIKRAYRKLAAKYHPDRTGGDKKKEEKFKEVNEAHEVLSDPEKRQRYDQLGANWKQGQNVNADDLYSMFGNRGRGGPFGAGAGRGGTTYRFETRGRPGGAGAGSFSDFFETLFGGMGGVHGGDEGTLDPFQEMEGGRLDPAHGAAQGHVETALTIPLEEAFRGATRRVTFQRSDESGPVKLQEYEVKIPAGIREGQKIRLKGQGSKFGRHAGDILITIHLAPHARYQLEGEQLTAELPLTPWEAALGGRISAPTLSGEVEVKVPAGIRAGQRLRVRGRGWPQKGGERGDLHLKVSILVPPELTDQERDLFEKLARVSKFNPREI